ncbi:cysteine desulfurase NifS [Gottschalkiaceae bacterium SANA]|nr:cysteine desulfurase NifS [Gottschalkiaceae bacterium SANA]
MIYLDNAATTPLDPEVLETMIEYMKTEYGNPSSKYYPQAERAKKALRQARSLVSDLIHAEDNNEIIFTSGATEGNNMIIKGVADAYQNKGKHLITTCIEHKAVLEPCKYLEAKGYQVTYLSVDQKGRISIEELEQAITDETILVTIMWGNNEIGTLQPIDEISKICKRHNVLFHTDATQVIGKVAVNLQKTNIDFLTCSAHKIYGPKGTGAVYIKNDEYGLKPQITPLFHGGSQEDMLRAGTHAMHNIVGFGKACEVAKRDMDTYIPRMEKIEADFIKELKEAISEASVNGDLDNKIPGIISITIPRISNEILIKRLSDEYAFSSGSACGLGEPSYVLENIHTLSENTLRITLSKQPGINLNHLLTMLTQHLKLFSI